MSSQTVVDVIVSGSTAIVVDERVNGVTTIAGAAPITNVSGQIPDLGVDTNILASQGDILSLTNDVASLRANLIITGTTLTDEIGLLSGTLISTGNELNFTINTLSGELIATGNSLDSLRNILSGNLITTGVRLQDQLNVNTDLIADLRQATGDLNRDKLDKAGGTILGNILPSASGTINLGSAELPFLSGHFKDLTVSSNTLFIGDVPIHSANGGIDFLSATGETFFRDVTIRNLTVTGTETIIDVDHLAVKDNTITLNSGEDGAGISLITGGIIIDRGSLQDADILFNEENDRFEFNFPVAIQGSPVVTEGVTGSFVTQGQLNTTGINLQNQIISNDTDISNTISNLSITGNALSNKISTFSGQVDLDFLSTGNLIDSLSGNLITTGNTLESSINSLTSNVGTTGQTLQAQITTNIGSITSLDSSVKATGVLLQNQITDNDSDISTLTSNLSVTGQTLQSQIIENDNDLNDISGKLGQTGVFLNNEIAIVSGIAGGDRFNELSGNLITTGQTLQTQIISNDSDISTLTTNIGATGQTLQTQITSNDSNISTLTSNLITTGQTLTTDISTVSGLITDNDADIAALRSATGVLKTSTDANTTNLITTGQTLQTQITSNDGDITTLTSNLVTTGQTLQTQITSNDSDISTLTTNIGTTGQTLQTQITSNDSDITSLTNNLITTGQTVTTDINTVSGLITDNDADITALKTATGVLKTSSDSNTANLITTGQTLQTQISSNDSDISTLTSNLVTTGQTLTTNINTVSSNLVSTGEVIDDVSGNLIITGQTLQTQITSNDGDITTLTSNLVTTGQTLTTNINTVSTNLVSTGKVIDDVSGNLITTGQTLQTQITSNDGDISTLTSNLVTTGQTLTTNVNTVSTNLISTGAVVDDISGNLITTGQTLQTQINSNDGDITTLTSNLVTTGQTLTTNINTVSTNLGTSGQTLQTQITSNDSDISTLTSNLGTTGQTLQTQITSNDSDIASLTTNLGTTGQTLQTQITSNDSDISTLDSTTVKLTTNQSVAGNKIFTNNVTINNLTVTGTEVIVDVENLAVKDNIIEINSGESSAGISKISGGIVIDRGTATNANILFNDANDRFELNFPLAVEGEVVASASNLITTGQTLTTNINTVSTNLGTSGQTLQTQITSNDSDISTLTTNLGTSGQTLQTQITSNDSDISTLTTNLGTSGQTLQTQITSNDSDISTLTSNLVTTGQTLQTQITSNDSDISTLTTNVGTTGQTLQTQITSNDSDISTLTSNLVTTGQTLTTNINTVANNLGTTGQTLTSEIATVSGLIPATVIDGAGTANKVPLWSDSNTIGDSVISQSSSKVGIGTVSPAQKLHVAGSTLINNNNYHYGYTAAGAQATLIGIKSNNYVTVGQDNANHVATTIFGGTGLIEFSTGGSTRMTLTSGGNVGIGTNNPDSKLHVESSSAAGANFILETTHSGGIPLLDLKGAHSAQLRYKDESDVIQGRVDFGDSGTFNFIDVPNNSSTLYLKTGGNVGIGTINPSAKLDVNGDSELNGVVSILDGNDIPLRVESSDSTAMISIADSGSTSSTSNGILVHTDDLFLKTAGSERMRIDSSGDVGIGTVSPSAKLHVIEADTGEAFRIDGASGGFAMLVEGGTSYKTRMRGGVTIGNGYGASTPPANGLIVESNLGIGTVAPASLLHIYSSAPVFTVQDGGAWGTNATAYVDLKDGSSSMAYVGVTGTDGHLDIKQLKAGSLRLYTNNTERVSILSNGNVGIGTAAPGTELHVKGAGTVAQFEGTGGNVFIQFKDSDDGTLAFIGADGGDLKFQTPTGSYSDKLTIKNDGKVGIGMTPATKLDITGTFRVSDWGHFANTGENQIVLSSSGSNFGFIMNPSAGVWSLGYGSNRDALGTSVLSWSSSNLVTINNAYNLFLDGGNITLENSAGDNSATISNTGASGSSKINVADALYVIEGGNVGIGTPSPSAKLQVKAAISTVYANVAPSVSNSIIAISNTQTSETTNDQAQIQFGVNGGTYNRVGSIGLIAESASNRKAALVFATDDAGTRAEKMRITGDGNVGIGTTVPSKKLDVNGDVKIAGDTFNAGFLQAYGSNFNVGNNHYGVFIGTYSGGTSISPGEIILSTQEKTGWNVGDGLGRIRFFLGDASGVGVRDVAKIEAVSETGNGSTSTTASGALAFHTSPFNSQVAERMRIKSDGNVGIGTTNPTEKLEITGNVRVMPSSGDAKIRLTDQGVRTWDLRVSDGSDYFEIDGTTSTSLVVTGAGNVGIGKISPNTKLNIKGDQSANGQLYIEPTNDGEYAGLVIKTTRGADRAYAIFAGGTGTDDLNFRFRDYSASADRMVIDSAGNVGIGTAVPSQALTVAGKINAKNAMGVAGQWSSSQIRLETTNTVDTTGWHGISFDASTTGNYGWSIGVNRSGSGRGSFRFYEHVNSATGTERFTIEQDGNVGIGTNDPSDPLHVIGYIKSSIGFKAASYTTMLESGNESVFGNTAYYGVLFKTNNATRMKITNAGLVGIGTVTPSQKLHVVGKALITDDVQLTGSNPRIDFNTNGSSSLRFYDTTNAAERMRINTSGNLGINTTSPTSKLQVVGSTSGGSVLKVDGTNGTLFEVVDDLSDSLMSVNDAAGLPVFEVFADSHIVAGRYNQNDFYLDTNGNLGLGTSAPSSVLDIYEQSGKDNKLRFHNDTSGSGTSNGSRIGLNGAELFINNIENAAIKIYTQSTQTNGITILGDGKVGIGTVSPTRTLHVVGAIQIDGTIDANSGAHLTSGGVWTDASSRELKKDIVNLSLIKASQVVKLLNPVEFSYKTAPEERRVGFIAEDVPDLVASEGRKGLSSMQIVAALTKVVQNQQKEIEWCKEQIEKLTKIK